MGNLHSRFERVKTSVGGNREKRAFEFTFGMPRETVFHVTMPGKHARRIISELDFALRLSGANGGAFDAEICQALTLLEQRLAEDCAITRQACEEAETILMPLQGKAKEYMVLLAGHAHIDMNWMWGWQETVAVTLSTFRTVLGLMREYPDFKFSQSQTSVYKIVEDYDPSMMEEIRARIAEGRWEVTATSWVETDKNMPNTESLLRHISQTREYLGKVWNIDTSSLEVDFSPDTFGHSANIPEIDAYGGVKYFYHCRGLTDERVLYRWQAPSGRELLAWCEPYWYNSAIVPDVGIGAIELSKKSAGLKTSLIVYGVGDHGGGPTRRDIEMALEMMDWPVFPKLKFGTFREFFREAEAVRHLLPIVEGEINFFATGCYTTQSRLKLGNRHCEAALLDAEAASALSRLLCGGAPYPEDYFNRAWRNVLFSHFHDILTGSCVQESREHAMGLFADSMAVANTAREQAMRLIASHIDTSGIAADAENEGTQSEGAGAGYGINWYDGVPNPESGRGKTRVYHVFNPTPRPREEVAEFTAWDWTGDIRRLEVVDYKGNKLDSLPVDKEYQSYWDHKYYRFLAKVSVPAMGYTTVIMREAELETYPFYTHAFPRSDMRVETLVLENEHLRAEFDPGSGRLVSLVDKKTGGEQVRAGEQAGLALVRAERRSNSAWQIGRHLGEEPVTRTLSITPLPRGALRNGFVLEQQIWSSSIKTTVTLDAGAKALAYTFEIAWHEYAKDGENVPVLEFAVPLLEQADAYQSDVPGGAVRRREARHDVPGLQYTAAVRDGGRRALAIVTDCKYGYRGWNNTLSATLINTAGSPDPYPERGNHRVKLWLALDESCPKALNDTAAELCHPLRVLSGGVPGGKAPEKKLPLTRALFALESGSVVLSSVAAKSNGLLCRMYETCGRDAEAVLALPFTPKSAKAVDLNGAEMDIKAEVDGGKVKVSVPANRIVGVMVEFTGD
ncbi:MAG: hypothetical protein LBS62_00970 [Clostridiales bacterium]|jgi:alpha-mannosidase|nr:hypothetical protein [Clostridiales bacterium]